MRTHTLFEAIATAYGCDDVAERFALQQFCFTLFESIETASASQHWDICRFTREREINSNDIRLRSRHHVQFINPFIRLALGYCSDGCVFLSHCRRRCWVAVIMKKIFSILSATHTSFSLCVYAGGYRLGNDDDSDDNVDMVNWISSSSNLRSLRSGYGELVRQFITSAERRRYIKMTHGRFTAWAFTYVTNTANSWSMTYSMSDANDTPSLFLSKSFSFSSSVVDAHFECRHYGHERYIFSNRFLCVRI